MTEHFVTGTEIVQAQRLPRVETPEEFASLNEDEQELIEKYSRYTGKQGAIQDRTDRLAAVNHRPADQIGIDRDRYPQGGKA